MESKLGELRVQHVTHLHIRLPGGQRFRLRLDNILLFDPNLSCSMLMNSTMERIGIFLSLAVVKMASSSTFLACSEWISPTYSPLIMKFVSRSKRLP